MTKERYKGERLGYLEYHVSVLEESHAKLVEDLSDIRAEHDGDKRYKREQQRLLDFHNNVSERLEKIIKQIDGVKKHENESVLDKAEEIRESAYHVHQEKGLESIPHNTGFKTAKEHQE